MSGSRPLSWSRRVRRRVNRRFYRFLFRLYRAVFPTPRWTGAIPAGSRRRILVVRDDRVGDLVVTTPLLAFLAESAPGCEIDVLASSANAPLLRGDDRVARVFTTEPTLRGTLRVLSRLRRRRYDAVISPVTLKGLRQGFVASLIAHSGTYKVSSWRPVRYQGLFTTVVRLPPDATHMADQVLAVGQAAFGIGRASGTAQRARYPMRIALDRRAGTNVDALLAERGIGQFVVVNLSSAVARRDWAAAHCAEFVSLMLARHPDLCVLLTPAPGKESVAIEVGRRSADSRVVLASTLPLLELVALVARAYAVVSPSTALVHFASALGRPIVALYAPLLPPDVALWLPRNVPYRAVSSGLGGRVSDIPVVDIAAAFDGLRAELEGAGEDHATRGASGQRAPPALPER